jgi:predicted metal-binding membrane protein
VRGRLRPAWCGAVVVVGRWLVPATKPMVGEYAFVNRLGSRQRASWMRVSMDRWYAGGCSLQWMDADLGSAGIYITIEGSETICLWSSPPTRTRDDSLREAAGKAS